MARTAYRTRSRRRPATSHTRWRAHQQARSRRFMVRRLSFVLTLLLTADCSDIGLTAQFYRPPRLTVEIASRRGCPSASTCIQCATRFNLVATCCKLNFRESDTCELLTAGFSESDPHRIMQHAQSRGGARLIGRSYIVLRAGQYRCNPLYKPPRAYSPECVEGEFCELRLLGILESWISTLRSSRKFATPSN